MHRDLIPLLLTLYTKNSTIRPEERGPDAVRRKTVHLKKIATLHGYPSSAVLQAIVVAVHAGFLAQDKSDLHLLRLGTGTAVCTTSSNLLLVVIYWQ